MDDVIDLAARSVSGLPAGSTFGLSLRAAAQRSDRERLADVRRGQYEGLKAEIGQNGREPDFGRAACTVGRRGGRRRARS